MQAVRGQKGGGAFSKAIHEPSNSLILKSNKDFTRNKTFKKTTEIYSWILTPKHLIKKITKPNQTLRKKYMNKWD